MDLSTVTYAAKGGIARVVLNRPEQLNAISPTLLEDLNRVCETVEGDPGVRIVAKSASASRTVKALVNRAFDADLAGGLEMELHLVAAHMRSADAAEGLRAFAEKRKPVFHAL